MFQSLDSSKHTKLLKTRGSKPEKREIFKEVRDIFKTFRGGKNI